MTACDQREETAAEEETGERLAPEAELPDRKLRHRRREQRQDCSGERGGEAEPQRAARDNTCHHRGTGDAQIVYGEIRRPIAAEEEMREVDRALKHRPGKGREPPRPFGIGIKEMRMALREPI